MVSYSFESRAGLRFQARLSRLVSAVQNVRCTERDEGRESVGASERGR
jgi:hypothetical protein